LKVALQQQPLPPVENIFLEIHKKNNPFAYNVFQKGFESQINGLHKLFNLRFRDHNPFNSGRQLPEADIFAEVFL